MLKLMSNIFTLITFSYYAQITLHKISTKPQL